MASPHLDGIALITSLVRASTQSRDELAIHGTGSECGDPAATGEQNRTTEGGGASHCKAEGFWRLVK